MLPTNLAAPSASPGPAKEKVDIANATAATFVAVEITFFIIRILFEFYPKTFINIFS
jgi:hypothetical protein